MEILAERELLVFRGLRSRVFARARLLFPILHPEVESDGVTLDSFDYIPAVAGLAGTIYITLQDSQNPGPHAFPAKLFIACTDQEAVSQAREIEGAVV